MRLVSYHLLFESGVGLRLSLRLCICQESLQMTVDWLRLNGYELKGLTFEKQKLGSPTSSGERDKRVVVFKKKGFRIKPGPRLCSALDQTHEFPGYMRTDKMTRTRPVPETRGTPTSVEVASPVLNEEQLGKGSSASRGRGSCRSLQGTSFSRVESGGVRARTGVKEAAVIQRSRRTDLSCGPSSTSVEGRPAIQLLLGNDLGKSRRACPGL